MASDRALLLIPAGVCGVLVAPMAFSDDIVGGEWLNHVWLVWVQGRDIQDFGFPSYFAHSTSLGAYYPFYAFYGATLYAVGGLFEAIVGAVTSVVLLYLAAFAAAYAGWTWLAIQAGLRGWVAYLPGCIAVTSPYAVTVAYGRGDFAETVATSMLPLVAASGLSIFRADRLKATTVAVFIVSLAVLTGSHTLTLVWGVSFLLIAALIAALSWTDQVRRRTRRLFHLAGLSLLGLAVNAWFLVPLALYSQRTLIGEHPRGLSQTSFTEFGQLISPLRSTPQISLSMAGGFQAQLPVLALVCGVTLCVLAWTYLPRERRRFAVGLAGLLGGVVLLILAHSLIEHLPRFWRFIQFPYRLLTYADLAVIGLLILGLAGARARPRIFRAAGIVVALVAVLSTAQALTQALSPPTGPGSAGYQSPDREIVFDSLVEPPPTWIAERDFADVSEPVVAATLAPGLNVPIARSHRSEYELRYRPGPAGTAETNITAGPYLVSVDGARIVGRTSDQRIVLQLPKSTGSRTVSVSPPESAPIVAGQAISVAAVLCALILIGALAIRNRPVGRGGFPTIDSTR